MFHLNCSVGSCNIQVLGGNLEVKNEKLWYHDMNCINYQHQFLEKTQKPLQYKGSKMVRWWPNKEKDFWTYLEIS